MIDPALIRNNFDLVRENLARRGVSIDEGRFGSLETKRKEVTIQLHELQHRMNLNARAIGAAKKNKEDASELLSKSTELKATLTAVKDEERLNHDQYQQALLDLPNLLHSSVPDGENESHNKLIRSWGTPSSVETPPHHELFPISMDFAKAAQISSARFSVLKGVIAKLQRSLAMFMLEEHIKDGFLEVYVPYLVNRQALIGTGQLPRFRDDLFCISEHQERFLIPTAEVPVTNLVANTILSDKELPLRFVCHSPCFRSEAGSYGKDLQGLMRQHQFEKVELVYISKPEESESCHEQLVAQAEKIMQLLEIPYRVMHLCSGDTGFSAASTYDIEAWLPSQQAYREISSCSNCHDFQARRLQARYRASDAKKPSLCHTLNGSGVAIGRALIALIENHYHEADKSIVIPKALVPYTGFERFKID